jgi:hypothetical protein
MPGGGGVHAVCATKFEFEIETNKTINIRYPKFFTVFSPCDLRK